MLLTSISAAALAAGLMTFPAQALAQATPQVPPVSAPDTATELGEVIVTGVTEKTRKLDATFSINTLTAEDIQGLAAIGTADLLQNIPGIYGEGSSAGEASNNITVRGLPVTGGYRYAPQLIDGLPVYEEPEVQFMNNDVFIRTDLMTERVEVVKGGPGGILYSNGLGATVNYVTRTGGDTLQGGYKLELADYGFIRNDAYISGPITDNLTFAVGGFYRESDGIRDTGYTADHGGQIRGNLVWTSDDGSWDVQLHAILLRDHTGFYQNVPFTVPRLAGPGTPENPTEIDQDTIEPLGIDFGEGTVASPFNRRFTQIGEYGTRDIDLADGINPEFDIYTLRVSKALASGWRFSAGLRHTTGSNGFNAMFTGNDTTTAAIFNNARYQNDLISPAHFQALTGQYDAAKLQGFFTVPGDASTVFPNISREDFIANYARAQGVGAFYLDDGARVADSTLVNFLLPFIARTDAESTSFDFQVRKSAQWLGQHDFTFGAYASDYSNDQNFQASLLVSTMEETSRLADLRALDASGNPFGPSLTLDGAILPGYFGYVSTADAKGQAFYLQDHWELLDSRLKLDLGVRWQSLDIDLVRRDRNVVTNLTPAGVTPGSDADTTADDEVSLPGAPRVFDDDFDAFGWSVGGNYSIRPNFAVYGLVSRSFRLPSLEDINEFRIGAAPVVNGETVDLEQIERIWQYETGLRYQTASFDTSVAVFYNEFEPRDLVNVYRDIESAQCNTVGGVTQINTCPEVPQLFRRGIKNLGAEIEMTWRPAMLEGLELKGSVVVQDPEIEGSNYTITEEVRDTSGVLSGYRFRQVGEDGRRPRRLAQYMVHFNPLYDLRPMTGVPVKLYAQYSFFGERFSESTDFNVTLYPEYYTLNLGGIYDVNERLAFQVHVANVTDQLSFTEGDPIFSDLFSPDGARNRGVGRPLFGRTLRATLNYRF